MVRLRHIEVMIRPRMLTPPRRPALAVVLLLATACGGGGGSPNPAPTLMAATLLQSGATPAAGDRLLLLMSEAVQLTGGAMLDDADLALGGGTLGTVTAVPVLLDARTVQVTLGAGVSLTPGHTTLDFAPGNDAVSDLGGALAKSVSTPALLLLGDGGAPTVQPITLDRIDSLLNGTGPAGGTLQVPRSGFTIDVDWFDTQSGIDPSLCLLTASVPVTVAGATRTAGTNLLDALTRTDTSTHTSWLVPGNVLFGTGSASITLFPVDGTGVPGTAQTLAFKVVGASDDLRPLERGQTWFLSFDRDIEGFQLDTSGVALSVNILAGANGIADAIDVLFVLGIQSTNPLPNVTPGVDSNQFVLQRFRDTLHDRLVSLFPGVSIEFTFDSPGNFPSGQASVPYRNLSFSRICIAGAAAATPTGTLGAALFDSNNQSQDDDCITDFNGQRLGIFLHTYAHVGLRAGATSSFRQTFAPFIPQLQSGAPPAAGVPIGEDGQDAARLLGTLNDTRRVQIDNAIAGIARATAVVVAHECGHSLGLVANDAMPSGLYGNDPVHFPTNSAAANLHIETPTLFPAGAQNVMSPSISYDAAINSATGFNSLNLAYLRERALYDKH
ncbi:MAG: hypothetical protein U1F36_20105 [Planctomycetota bacterium]